MGRVLAVDPGEKRLGIAISDPFCILATPLTVIKHENMTADCQKIIYLCEQNDVSLILIGQALSSSSDENAHIRHTRKLAQTIGLLSTLPVLFWDESESTKLAKRAAIDMGMKKKKRAGHLDDHAAAVILQSYLDAQQGRSADEA